jgi:hypothetical protein
MSFEDVDEEGLDDGGKFGVRTSVSDSVRQRSGVHCKVRAWIIEA